MKKMLSLVVLCMMVISTAGFAASPGYSSRAKLHGISAQGEEKQSMIVRFSSQEAMERFSEFPDLAPSRFFGFLSPYIHWIPGKIQKRFADFSMMVVEMTGEQAARLAKNREVLYIEPDITYYLFDPLPGGLHYAGVTPTEEYQYGLASLGVTEALHKAGYLGQGVKVGVIDTGIDSNHPDLNVPMGWSFMGGTDSPQAGDVLGHGTHVAGIIAAKRNGFGVVGVAPQAELYSIQVFNIFGQASLGDIIEGVQWAIDQGLDILNMSFGISTYSSAFREVLEFAYQRGILLIAAAGNSGRSDDDVAYPAKYQAVVAVSAVDEENKIANFSSRGPDVEVAAPGVEVLSTFSTPPYYEHTYEYLSGTSMATPHVVGLAALIWGANPGMTNAEVRQRLKEFALDLGAAGRDIDYGWGIPQADRAFSVSQGQAPVAVAGGPYRGAVGEPVPLSAQGTLDPDDNLLTFDWDFGDGSTGQGLQLSHTYQRAGDYTVLLTVHDQDGNQGSAEAQVSVRGGIEHLLRLGASETGYVKEPNSLSLGRKILAGISMGKQLYGVMNFNLPEVEDIFLLSIDLEMTGSMRSDPGDQGVITVGMLPEAIAGGWPDFSYDDIAQAQVAPLEPSLLLTPLFDPVGKGVVNSFSLSSRLLGEVRSQFRSGNMAFRVKLETAESATHAAWVNPQLVVRYLDQASSINSAPIVRAGYDRRAFAGSQVVLDGSASYDPDGDSLSYEWVQIGGVDVALSQADSPIARFTAPVEDDILVFDLRASDGSFQVADEVKIFLNAAPAELQTAILTPAFGHSGFVEDDQPELNFFDKQVIMSGVLAREKQAGNQTVYGQTIVVGALQFDLSPIPPGSQVVSAALELTGARRSPDKKPTWEVRLLDPSIDHHWSELNYESLTQAQALVTLFPALNSAYMDEDRVNSFNINPSYVEERRGQTDLITFRVDGPKLLIGTIWEWFVWWSGNRPDMADKAPRLIVEYGPTAVEEPIETPSATPTGTGSPTPTQTLMSTATSTPLTFTPTPTATLPTPTPTPSASPSATPTPTALSPTPPNTPIATGPPAEPVIISVTRIGATAVDFAGREYFTARQGIHGNTGVSPLEIGDPAYHPSGTSYRSGWSFTDGGVSVDSGARFVVSEIGSSWSLALNGDNQQREVKIYLTVNHSSYGASSYEIRAGNDREEIVKTSRGRTHYEVSVAFTGNVVVEMETLVAESNGATFWLAGAVEATAVPAPEQTPEPSETVVSSMPATPTLTATPVPTESPSVEPTWRFTPEPTESRQALCPLSSSEWASIGRYDEPRLGALLPIWLGTEDGASSYQVREVGIAIRFLEEKVGDQYNGVTRLYAQVLAAELNWASGADAEPAAETVQEAHGFLAQHTQNDWEGLRRNEKYQVLGWIEELGGYNQGQGVSCRSN